MDRYQLILILKLIEKTGSRAVKGDKSTLQSLIELDSGNIKKSITISAFWNSLDGVKVFVNSALVPSEKAVQFARRLAKEKPFDAWLLSLEEYSAGHEFIHGKPKGYEPMIVKPTGVDALEKHDPNMVKISGARPRLVRPLINMLGIKSKDPFGKFWTDSKGKVVLESQAWGSVSRYSNNEPDIGNQLSASPQLLKNLLRQKESDLILLVRLENYIESRRYDDTPSEYWNTTAVVRIDRNLKQTFYPGVVNDVTKT
jgi:hypothetical protein